MKGNFMADHISRTPRDPYRSFSPPRPQRWDSQRFALEQERERARKETTEHKSYGTHSPPSYVAYSPSQTHGRDHGRERSVGPRYAQRVHRASFNEDEYFEPPHLMRERPPYERKQERYHSPPVLEKRSSSRPAFLRRQSSLDTFDRKPVARYGDRELYSPPARYREPSLPPRVPIPLPNTRHPMVPRRHERGHYGTPESDNYDDDDDSYREYAERTRAREHGKRRGRRKSRASRRSRSVRSKSSSSSSDSSSSSYSDGSVRSARSEFPKPGRTKIPAKLVCRKAIIDLGYPFKEKDDCFIVKRALGRNHIDELIKLSEEYKYEERSKSEIVQERTEIYTVTAPPVTSAPHNPLDHRSQPVPVANLPPPPAPIFVATPVYAAPAAHTPALQPAIATQTTQQLAVATPAPQQPSHATPAPKTPVLNEVVLYPASENATKEPGSTSHENALATTSTLAKDERAISAEIRALEAEKEVLRAQRRIERLRLQGRGEIILSEQTNRDGQREEVTILRREARSRSRPGGIRIEKDHKGMSSRMLKALLYTQT